MSFDVIVSTDNDVVINQESADDCIVLQDDPLTAINVPEQGPPGPQGPPGVDGSDGNSVLYGAVPPSPAQGVDGDFYVDTAAHMLYGPKQSGLWPPPVSLVGPQPWQTPPTAWVTATSYVASPPASVVTFPNTSGKSETYVCAISHTSGVFATDLAAGKWVKIAAAGADGIVGANGVRGSLWFEGAGPPGTIAGVLDQDNYLNVTNGDVYNYVASGSTWGSPVGNIRGPTGAAGAPGPSGNTICYVGTTPPASPADGTMWWKSDTGQLYVRYNDGNSTQWVAATPTVDASTFVLKSGDTMGGMLSLLADPTTLMHAATKQYVDANPLLDSNYYFSVSFASNAATYALKNQLTGLDPSPSNPVYLSFPQATNVKVIRAITGPLSITIPAGATLGVPATYPFRVWIAAFDDAGTVRLAVRSCSNISPILSTISPPEYKATSSLAPPASASHTFYTGSVAVTGKFWRWLAIADYDSALATTGNWTANPSSVALVDKTTPRPGSPVQKAAQGSVFTTSCSNTSLTGTSSAVAINCLYAMSHVRVHCMLTIYLRAAAGGQQGTANLYRDAVALMAGTANMYTAASTDAISSAFLEGWDAPKDMASHTYQLQVQNQSTGAGLVQYNSWNFSAEELMA